jgi:hypothetical protein
MNLYEMIEYTKNKYQQEHDKYMVLRSKMSYYDMSIEPDAQMHQQYGDMLKQIEKTYNIDCFRLARIISKVKGEEYRLKVFRKLYGMTDEERYTYEYTAAFVNKDSKYFDNGSDKKEICLYASKYAEMQKSLNDTNAIIMAKFDNYPLQNLYDNLNTINFIELFTQGYNNKLGLLTPEFRRQVRPIIEVKLQQIKIDEHKQESGNGCNI